MATSLDETSDDLFFGGKLRRLKGYLTIACFREGYEDWRDAGVLFHDAQNHCWRPTLWGACLFTWPFLFPFKQYRTKRMLRRTNKLIAELRSETMGTGGA